MFSFQVYVNVWPQLYIISKAQVHAWVEGVNGMGEVVGVRWPVLIEGKKW